MTEAEKQQLYEKIDAFCNQRRGKSKLCEVRYYVDTATAKDRAAFFGYATQNDAHFNKENFKRVIDLTFGSGNLTTHLLLDNDVPFETLILNDKNEADVNKDLSIGEQRYHDILEPDQFSDLNKFDLIIFNPQLGGKETYPAGVLEIESTEPIVHEIEQDVERALQDFADLTDCTVTVDPDERSIFVHSDTLTKTEMRERFREIKIFNYYDFFYQSKETKIEGEASNLVKFRKTFDLLSHVNTTIVMLADEKDFEKFFKDFNYYAEYLPDEGKRLFIGRRIDGENRRICFERKEDSFVRNTECKRKSDPNDSVDADLDELVYDVDQELSDLQNVEGGELFSRESENRSHHMEDKPKRKKRPFKNFLLED